MNRYNANEIYKWAGDRGYDDAYTYNPMTQYEEFTSRLMTTFSFLDITEVGQLAGHAYDIYESNFRMSRVASSM
jgi:hypothetical protein